MTLVKICGITNFSDAKLAVDVGADAIGFNFYPGSKRFISAPEAESIVHRLLSPVFKVGVFVNETIEEIDETASIVELDAIQLHGDETPDFIDRLRKWMETKIIKAVRTGPDFIPSDVLRYDVDAILLDAYSCSERGGTGRVIDLSTAEKVSTLVDRLYLAGGLSPENVAEAISTVKPYAVDACSCLETSAGKKDPEKVAAFIKAAKEAI